jgi:Uncharacterized conserved protein
MNLIYFRAVALLVGLAFSACIVQTAAGQWVNPAEPKAAINVSGTAEIRVAPDEVNLRLGIETRSPQLDPAVKQNETNTAAVLKFLKDSGIAAKDIQTDYLEIHPNHDRQEHQVIPEYYVVRRNLGVRLRKVSQFDEVLAGALRSGVNYVLGIEFRTTELRKHRDAARQQAVRAAKEKAEALSKELGVKLGKATSINEQTGGGYWGWAGGSYPYGANVMSQVVSQAAPPSGGESSDGNLAVGMISVTATINVSFALE